jgi:triosephosphate isomerase
MTRPRFLVGTSLKTYFTHARATAWAADVAQICRRHPAVTDGSVEVFVLPTFVSIAAVRAVAADGPLRVGAQDVSAAEPGAHTGEVAAAELAEIGCALVAVGHAERRRDHGETDEVVSAKVAATLRHGLVPLICVGEPARGTADDAATACRDQVLAALQQARDEALGGEIAVAYEPVWAIGAAEPADDEHIRSVCAALRTLVADTGSDTEPLHGRVLYGGSAGPRLLTRIAGEVDGVFLGRFAHDPAAVRMVLDEAAAVVAAERSRR